MTVVSTMATTKDERIYVRVNAEIKEEFKKLAEFRGLDPSAILHSFIVRTVREAKVENPEIFSEKIKEVKILTLDEAIADDVRKK